MRGMIFPLPSLQLRVALQTPQGVVHQSKVWLSLMEEPISNPTGNIFSGKRNRDFPLIPLFEREEVSTLGGSLEYRTLLL